ncbi:MAG: hypothetical protein QXX87_05200 [Candidatus Jordarchaeales archaeon]
MHEDELEEFIRLVELNVGSISLSAIAIMDESFRIWAVKGKIEDILELLKKYRNVSLNKMKVGDEVHDDGSFLMKVTDRTLVLASPKNPLLTKIAIANLRGRINALSILYVLDKLAEQKTQEQMM